MFRSESTTPYTSFASSSNDNDEVGGGGIGAIGLCVCVGSGVCGTSSLTATTMPEDGAENVFRLPYIVSGLACGYTGA